MAQDFVRNAQKNPHITAKKMSKHRSSFSEDNTTYFKQKRPTWQSCQKERPQHKIKCPKYAKENKKKLKPFGTMCFGLTKPKWNFLATSKEMFGAGGGFIMLCSCVATGGTGDIVRVEGKNGFHQKSRNSRG